MAPQTVPAGTIVSVPQWENQDRTARLNVRVHSTFTGDDGRGRRMAYFRAVYPGVKGTLYLTTFAAAVAEEPIGDGTVDPRAEAETARLLAAKGAVG